MGKKNAQAKKRITDPHYRKAKEQGYRSRASFKLLQMDSKFSLLSSSRAILDLCAAPGGWVQVAVRRAPVGALVVGVDMVHIRPIRGAVCVQEDIRTSKCASRIKTLLDDYGVRVFDLVLHDGSPNVGGAWFKEATSQNALVIDSLRIATPFLAPKGNFVTKVFRSQDYNAVVYCLRKLFDKVEVYKPNASTLQKTDAIATDKFRRNVKRLRRKMVVCDGKLDICDGNPSVGLRYLAPAKIDPRLLDIKHLFEGATEPQKVIDVLNGGKQKRHRDGYEEGLTLVRKIRSASEFVWSDNPIEMLGTTTSISFNDSSSLPLKEHVTTDEVITLCEDLSVLGKQDFKHLLKWRISIRKAISSTEKISAIVATVKENDTEEQDEDGKLLDEMEELTHAVERKKKREKKIQAKRQAKDKARKATGMQIDAMQDGYVDNELFCLGSIKGTDDLATIDATEDLEFSESVDSDDCAIYKVDDHGESCDFDSDKDRERYDEKMEKMLDEAYEHYVTRKEGSTKQRKRAKKAYTDEHLEDADDIAEPYDSDKDEADQEANPLIDPIEKETVPTQEELRNIWFGTDIFVQAVEEGDLGMDESEDDGMIEDVPKHKVSSPTKTSISLEKKLGKKSLKKMSTKVLGLKKDGIIGTETQIGRTGNVQDDLEVVPAPGNSSDISSSDDDSEYDSDTKAELRVIGKKMLGSKRKRQEMEDMAYNKYMCDDDYRHLPKCLSDFPTIFEAPKLVTNKERLAEKTRFNEINARPTKKVAEAKARKKRVAMRNLEKLRKKANSIADQTDINDRSKRRMIDQLYIKAAPKKPVKVKVVAKKGVQVRPGKGQVFVDRRMKKDARQHGMSKKVKNVKAKGKSSSKGIH